MRYHLGDKNGKGNSARKTLVTSRQAYTPDGSLFHDNKKMVGAARLELATS
jgi:hypothetical protein